MFLSLLCKGNGRGFSFRHRRLAIVFDYAPNTNKSERAESGTTGWRKSNPCTPCAHSIKRLGKRQQGCRWEGKIGHVSKGKWEKKVAKWKEKASTRMCGIAVRRRGKVGIGHTIDNHPQLDRLQEHEHEPTSQPAFKRLLLFFPFRFER